MPKSKPPGADPFVPEARSLPVLRKALQDCRGCDLYSHATQGVLGEGPAPARVMLVGEQPGDEEDIRGRPFVGPAGKMLDKALAEAGLDRTAIFVTNVVKHFKFEERGKLRIHKKPNTSEVTACNPWLAKEVEVVRPEWIVCLGATAAQALLGSQFRLTQERGKMLQHPWASVGAIATVHPSLILRIPEPEQRQEEYERLVADLRFVRSHLTPGSS
jgi:uracil-DNA glycosylase family protein